MINSLKLPLIAITYFLVSGSATFYMHSQQRLRQMQESFRQEAGRIPRVSEILGLERSSHQADIESLEAILERNHTMGRSRRIRTANFLLVNIAILVAFEELNDKQSITELMRAARDGDLAKVLELVHSSHFNLGYELYKKDYLGRTVDYYARNRLADSHELKIRKLAIRMAILKASIAWCSSIASHYLPH